MKHPQALHSIKSRAESGRTLLEMLVVVVIIVILASLIVPLVGHFKRKAQDAGCMTNLRSLHASLGSYMLDHSRVWPQIPNGTLDDDSGDSENDSVAEFWFKTLEPYGAHRETWLCPSERASFKTDFDEKVFDSSYGVTEFEDTPDIAYKWYQPWLVERGGFHMGDANRVMPDGSIRKEYFPFE